MTRTAPQSTTWDLLVVGGGSAGIVGAKTAARLGARVALAERARPGGDCLFTGCVPSKSLLAAASAAASARTAGRLGVHVDGLRVDFAAVMAHVQGAIATIEPTDSPAALERAGVTVLPGDVEFSGPGTATVAGRPVSFHRALVATGASPAVPPVPGLREAAHVTSETVWDLGELPRRLVVLGGGSIGCELGQAFARLGSDVTILEGAPRLLPREDPDAAALVAAALQADGVTVLTGEPVSRVEGAHDGRAGSVVVGDGTAARTVDYDVLLVAVGRTPTTAGLGLDAAGVALDERGAVVVDASLRTTNPRVWAAGDVTPLPQFTHVAGVNGSIAASNAVLGLRRAVDTDAVPRVTYTDPEVAAVGADSWAEDGERLPGRRRTVTRRHDGVDRAVAEGRTDGFARLVLDRRRRVVGATVVGPRAGESLAELVLAVRHEHTTADLGGTTHPYPTYGDGPWNAAVEDVQQRLGTLPVRLLTRTAVLLQRHRRPRPPR